MRKYTSLKYFSYRISTEKSKNKIPHISGRKTIILILIMLKKPLNNIVSFEHFPYSDVSPEQSLPWVIEFVMYIDPLGLPTVTAGSDHCFCISSIRTYVRPSVPTFQNKTNFKRKQFLLLARLLVWQSGSLLTPVLCAYYFGTQEIHLSCLDCLVYQSIFSTFFTGPQI